METDNSLQKHQKPALILAGILLSYLWIILVLLTAFRLYKHTQPYPPFYYLTLFLAYPVCALVPWAFYRLRRLEPADIGWSSKNLGRQAAIGLLIAVLLALLFLGGPLLFGAKLQDILAPAGSPSLYLILVQLVYQFFFVALFEEAIFRGFFFHEIRELARAEWAAILLSAALFGLMHYPNAQSLLQVLFTSLIGLIFAIFRARVKDANLIALSLGHGLYGSILLASRLIWL